MAMTRCAHCGSKTNTAVIDHDQEAKCLAKFDDSTKKYVKGCGYDTAANWNKASADSVINR